jgi:uncharacterized membrane protein
MNVLYYIKLYILTFIVFLGIDFVWLAKIAPNFYKSNIGHLLAEKPNLFAGFLFYVLNIVGILVFCVVPALRQNSAKTALLFGALYGIMTYATYDLTNFATLRGWPVKVVVVDILWGMVLTSVVSLVSYHLISRFG